MKLTSDIEERQSVVQADSIRMQQVIGNILSNAIKFTPPGKQVELKMKRDDHKLEISVTDQGEGIEASFLPHVFERLRQADASATRSGLGLGLAIARHIVESAKQSTATRARSFFNGRRGLWQRKVQLITPACRWC